MTNPAVATRPEPADDPKPHVSSTTEQPQHRSVTANVTGGLASVLRVVTLLHGRRYRVRNLSADVRDGMVESRVSCTVLATTAETALLLERLNRIPVVVSTENR
ncbi:MAG TPA: hypothetical protein VG756_28990 [Pseudonocardiaceae bacterium]|jgi:hypothetical protein|nr:hypothetical protein [Pseudonocardiaceae bacterium]